MTTDIAKYSIGRLRPHFIDVCQPVYKGMIFSLDNPQDCVKYQFQYITDFECNPNNKFDDHTKKDARLSFMSGHSSFAAYCLIYLVVSYLWAFFYYLSFKLNLWISFQIICVNPNLSKSIWALLKLFVIIEVKKYV